MRANEDTKKRKKKTYNWKEEAPQKRQTLLSDGENKATEKKKGIKNEKT